MKQKLEPVYDIQVNGMPDYGKIPKATLEPIAKKFLEDILNGKRKRNRRNEYGRSTQQSRQARVPCG